MRKEIKNRVVKSRWPIPEMYQGTMKKAFTGKAPASMAIKAKCIECCCFDITVARDCKVPDCPLFLYNPYRLNKEIRQSKKDLDTIQD